MPKKVVLLLCRLHLSLTETLSGEIFAIQPVVNPPIHDLYKTYSRFVVAWDSTTLTLTAGDHVYGPPWMIDKSKKLLTSLRPYLGKWCHILFRFEQGSGRGLEIFVNGRSHGSCKETTFACGLGFEISELIFSNNNPAPRVSSSVFLSHFAIFPRSLVDTECLELSTDPFVPRSDTQVVDTLGPLETAKNE